MYKIAICDDNPFFRETLKNAIRSNEDTPPNYTIYEYSFGEQMLMDMEDLFDLAIIDIQLPKKNGFFIAEELYKLNPEGLLVYCSGVVMPTMEAFRVQPYRYLLKQGNSVDFEENISDIMRALKDKCSLCCDFHIKNGEIVRKCMNDILYITSHHNGCILKCYTYKNMARKLESIHIADKMHTLFNTIKKDHFFLIQRSFFVNFNYIVSVKKDMIIMEDGLEINLSRKKRQEFHHAFSEYVGTKYKRQKFV